MTKIFMILTITILFIEMYGMFNQEKAEEIIKNIECTNEIKVEASALLSVIIISLLYFTLAFYYKNIFVSLTCLILIGLNFTSAYINYKLKGTVKILNYVFYLLSIIILSYLLFLQIKILLLKL